MFRVGQKVVCVKRGRNSDCWAGKKNCIPGNIYTVRDVHLTDNDEPAILVEEIINPLFLDTGEECGFYADRFRPVVARKTDIAALKALLNPSLEDLRAIVRENANA